LRPQLHRDLVRPGQLVLERRLDANTELTFKYKLTGANEVAMQLGSKGKGIPGGQQMLKLKAGEWSEVTVPFKLTGKEIATEIAFLLPEGAELSVDDVLLYTPGK